MSAASPHRTTARGARPAVEELTDCYARRLRPKLVRAARARTISVAAAGELDRQMASMLRLVP